VTPEAMTRALALLVAGLLLAAASPHASLPPSLPLPLPPPLPIDPPDDLAAPVPDYDPAAPDGSAQQGGTAWALRVYRMQEFGTGEGYIPGSAYSSPEQRKPMQTPGFMVTVPLQ
jgi:hypothetical protein